MRILRRQSHLEVSSQGLAYFVIGIVLSTFLGGAVRTLLQSQEVQARILQELKTRLPKHQVQVSGAEILLSRGIWPELALRLKGVTVHQDFCDKLSFQLSIPEMVLPVSLLNGLRGRLRLNAVEVMGGELLVRYESCEAKRAGIEKPPAAPSSSAQSASARTQSIQLPKVEWAQTAELLKGIEIVNFSVTYEANPHWKVLVKEAYLSLGKELRAQAAVEVQKSLPFGAISHPLRLDLRLDGSQLTTVVDAEFKEGRARLNGLANLGTQAAVFDLGLRQIPLKDFMSELSQMGLVEHDIKLKSTWLSCLMKWEGQLQNVYADAVAVKDCQIEGGYGRVDLQKAQIWLDGTEYFHEPVVVRVMQLQVQPILEAFNRPVLPAVFTQLGQWSGELAYLNRGNWTLSGQLENSEVVFANRSSRGKQVVQNVRTSIRERAGVMSVRLDEFKLRDGEMDGRIEGELHDGGQAGRFHVVMKRFSVAPAIQRLLVGGSIGPLTGEGSGVLLEGELKQFSGEFSVPEIKGDGWAVHDLRMRSRFQAGTVSLAARAVSARVNGSWSLYPELRRLMQDLPAELTWSGGVASVEVQKTGGTIQSLVAREEGGADWRLTGNWVRDGVFRGSLNIGSGRQSRMHLLRGENGRLTVVD